MNVIVVDDEKLILEYTVLALSGIETVDEVRGFNTAQAAIDHVKSSRTDVAFLDIEMPGMGGLELSKAIKAQCPETHIVFVSGYRQYAVEAFGQRATGYLVKPVTAEKLAEELAYISKLIPAEPPKAVRVQTLGNFEIFCCGKPIAFSRSKSKELLAYLVDRRGASATTRECFSVLFEDREYNRTGESYFQTIVAGMLAALKKEGIEDIVIKQWGRLAINTEKIYCDFYELLKKEGDIKGKFMGEYMSQYSWAEYTAGYLY